MDGGGPARVDPFPIERLNPLEGNDTVSVSGFGSGEVDVGKAINVISPTVISVGYVQRSASGDVITFGNFSSNMTLGYGGSDWFTFVVPGTQFGIGSAAASVLDVEGNARTIGVDAVGPVPEPASSVLLVLGVVGLGLRAGRHGAA